MHSPNQNYNRIITIKTKPSARWHHFKRIIYFALIEKNVHSISFIVLFLGISISAIGQIGGKHSFEFLNVSPAARLSALGGVNVSLADRDVNFFSGNPALAGDTLNGVASVNYQFYVGDTGHALFTYAHDFKNIGPLVFAIQHMRYGEIQGYDINGAETYRFNSGETAFMVGKYHQIRHFRLGVTLKGVFSNIAAYRAAGVMADFGGVFIHPEKPFTIGLVMKNIGIILNDYTDTNNNKLPFDVQIGTTFKPEHMPLRFTLTAFNLTQADVTYRNPASDPEPVGIVKKVLSHLNLGTEILIHKNVTIMAGYNYFVHQALKLAEGGGGAGLAYGFSANIRSFEFIFGRTAYVSGNAGYSFTLSTNVQKILKRR